MKLTLKRIHLAILAISSLSRGMYGAQGTLAPGNIPGSRGFMSGWTDANGNFWLFGVYGLVDGSEGDLSDL